MKKVYVIQAWYDYEGFDIAGIYTSKRRAEAVLGELRESTLQPDEWKIEGFKVNSILWRYK